MKLGENTIPCDLGVPRCCGAFMPSTRVVSGRAGGGWSLFLFRGRSDRVARPRCSAQALESSILAHYDDLPPKAQISYYFLHPFGAYFPSAEQKEFVDDYARHVSDSAWFPSISQLQLRADGVDAMPHRRDAVDVAVRASTQLV